MQHALAEPPRAATVVLDMLAPGKGTREIGQLAVWTVTSAKPGNGVEMLRDGREDTYWQSDGTQPHFVNIQFQRKVSMPLLAPCLAQTRLTLTAAPLHRCR